MDKAEERMQKIKNWFKDPYNISLAVLIVFTVAVRLYYFFTTLHQPLWYDEAEYMTTSRSWIGGTSWNFNPLRPVLFSLIGSAFYMVGSAEFLMRLFVLFSSIASVVLVYMLGNLMFKDKKISLIAAFLFSIFWSALFYSFRVLIDVPLVMMWLATIYLFLRAYKQDKGYWDYALAGIMLGLSFLMKAPSAVLIFVIGLYVLIDQRTRVFRNLKIWAFYLSSLAVVAPYLIWQKVAFGSFFGFYTAARGSVVLKRSFLQSLTDQVGFSLKILDIVMSAAIILGLIWILFELFIGREKILDKNSVHSSYLFVLIWIGLTLLFYGWMNYGDYIEERYYFVFYPAMFFIAGLLIAGLFGIIKKYSKIIAVVALVALLAFSGYTQLTKANQTIDSKKDSFVQLKLAGEWINNNTEKTDTFLMLEEGAELVYYADREYCSEARLTNITDLSYKLNKCHPKFIVFSFFYSGRETEQAKMITYVLSNPKTFVPVQAYEPYVDPNNTIPLTIIFGVNYNQNSSLSGNQSSAY